MYGQLLAGIQEELTGNGINLLLLPVHCDDFDALYETIKTNKLVNLIINTSSVDLSNIDFINFTHKLSGSGVNIVVIDIPVPGLKAGYIGQENTSAFTNLTRRFIEQGAKDIVAAGKFDSKVYFSRLKGIRDAVNGNAVRLRQIDISDKSLRQAAAEIAESRAGAVILCDAGSSVNLAYELRNILGSQTDKIQIGGIVEQNERLPLEHAVTLEKQNIEMGRAAVRMLLRKKKMSEVELLPIKILT
jgi:DNA-binding LacI/PurR family transcriptional regulator